MGTEFKRVKIFFALFLSVNGAFGQDVLEWSVIIGWVWRFKSPSTNLNTSVTGLHPGAKIEFIYQMSNCEFMLTENFNSKVVCKFLKEAASLQAPDKETAQNLIAPARYEFDLTELYARRIRKGFLKKKTLFQAPGFLLR